MTEDISLVKNCSGETIHWLIACGGRVGHYSILRTLYNDCDLKHNGKLEEQSLVAL